METSDKMKQIIEQDMQKLIDEKVDLVYRAIVDLRPVVVEIMKSQEGHQPSQLTTLSANADSNEGVVKEKIKAIISEITQNNPGIIQDNNKFKEEIKKKLPRILAETCKLSPPQQKHIKAPTSFFKPVSETAINTEGMFEITYVELKRNLVEIIKGCATDGSGTELSLSNNQSTAKLFGYLGRLLLSEKFIINGHPSSIGGIKKAAGSQFIQGDFKYLRAFIDRLGLGFDCKSDKLFNGASSYINECLHKAVNEYSCLMPQKLDIHMPMEMKQLLQDAQVNAKKTSGRFKSHDISVIEISEKISDELDALMEESKSQIGKTYK